MTSTCLESNRSREQQQTCYAWLLEKGVWNLDCHLVPEGLRKRCTHDTSSFLLSAGWCFPHLFFSLLHNLTDNARFVSRSKKPLLLCLLWLCFLRCLPACHWELCCAALLGHRRCPWCWKFIGNRLMPHNTVQLLFVLKERIHKCHFAPSITTTQPDLNEICAIWQNLWNCHKCCVTKGPC